MGPSPLSYEGIHAWTKLTGTVIRPIELMAIKEMDAVWIEIAVEAAESKRIKPGTLGKRKRK